MNVPYVRVVVSDIFWNALVLVMLRAQVVFFVQEQNHVI